jgi:hypothetical protein
MTASAPIAYKLIKANSNQLMESQVSDMLKAGWVPLGGISRDWNGHQCMQAMVMYEAENPFD